MESARVVKRGRGSGHPSVAWLPRPPLALDILVVLVTGCSTTVFITTAVTVSLLTIVGETRRYELCAFSVVVSSCLTLTTAVIVTVTPRALVANLHGCAATLVAHKVLTVRPLIGDLDEVGDSLRLYPSECLLEL